MEFKGKLDHFETLKALTKTKYLLLPSIREALPFVLLEGKICGCSNIVNDNLPIPNEFYDFALPLIPQEWVNVILNNNTWPKNNENSFKKYFDEDVIYKKFQKALNLV